MFRLPLQVAVYGFAYLLLATPVLAQPAPAASPFIGTWLSVDPKDHSSQTIEITKHGAEYKLIWRESHWTICQGRSGIMRGEGRLQRRAGRHDPVLEMQREVICFEPYSVVIRDTAIFEPRGNAVLLATAGNGAFQEQALVRASSNPVNQATEGKPKTAVISAYANHSYDKELSRDPLKAHELASVPVSDPSMERFSEKGRVVLSPQELALESPRMMDLRRKVGRLEEEVARLSQMIAPLLASEKGERLRP